MKKNLPKRNFKQIHLNQTKSEFSSSNQTNSSKHLRALTVLAIFALLISFNQTLSAQSLEVKSLNWEVRSANEDGELYLIQVTNNSSESQNFEIRISNDHSIQKNPDDSDASDNIDLLFEILDSNSEKIASSINLASGEKYNFQVRVTLPENVNMLKWNCAKLELVPNSSDPSVSLLLHTYVTDWTIE